MPVHRNRSAQTRIGSNSGRSYPFSVVISLMFGLSLTTYETLRYKLQAATLELRTRQVEQERAYKLLAEARLSSLESRIHPHFLFNTLNSIAALIPSDPQRAEDTVGKLASLLRFSLNANHSGLVQLEPGTQDCARLSGDREDALRPAPALRDRRSRSNAGDQCAAAGAAIAGGELGQARRLTAQPGRVDSHPWGDGRQAAFCLKSATTAPVFRSMQSHPSTGWAISSRASICFLASAGQLKVAREERSNDCPSLFSLIMEMSMEAAPLRAYLVDDEPLAIERLERLLAGIGGLQHWAAPPIPRRLSAF